MLLRSGLMMRTRRATWNPADKGSHITLTNGNLTGAGDATPNTVRATLAKSAGKWAFEVVIGVLGDDTFIGVATSGASLNGNLGLDAFGWSYRGLGTRFNNAGSTAGYATFGAGDVVTVYFDAGAGKIWWAKNGAVQGGGDPAAGTSPGFTTGAITAFPALSIAASATATIRPPAFTLPSGFLPW